MKKIALLSLLAAQPCLALPASARQIPPEPAQPVPLAVTVGIASGRPIDAKYAYCRPDGMGRTTGGGNINPAIRWLGAPKSTKSYAVIVVDRDVPATFDDANQPGRVIPANFPRQDFYHWVLVDIPPSITRLDEGVDSRGVTPGGKAPGKVAYGVNGRNDYAVKAGNGLGGGYDGPCPPWNDERVHRYRFIVYALDVASLNLPDGFTGKQAEDAMQGHTWARGEVVGSYSNNPKLNQR